MNCDLLLKNGIVIDGSGKPRYRADIAIKDGKITAIGLNLQVHASTTVDVAGASIAPGFIDVHTHDDRLVLADPSMEPKISQGATTVVTGNCGISLAPLGRTNPIPPINLVANDNPNQRFSTFKEYFEALEKTPSSMNVASLVGHTTMRTVTMQDVNRPANEVEIAQMQKLVQEALDAGVVGVSTGLYYAPAQEATASEVQAVFEPLRGTNAVIASHIRDEAEHVLEAMTEAMSIANALGVRQIISHHKVNGRANHGRSTETLALVDEARTRMDVCMDCYPYVASSTILRQDNVEQASRTLIAWSTPKPETAGRYVDELLKEQNLEFSEFLASLQPAGAIYFSMDEADVERIMAHPETMIGSDGLPHDTFPHPRLWGAFPRVLGHYSRDRKIFPLETAIYKMTGMPAAKFGLKNRGLIAEGYAADLVVFDPEQVRDCATFADPKLPAAGIQRVYVNGVTSWRNGASTGARAGQVIRRS
jgi:N-acyl-D-amino-acid deacylase